MDRNMRKKVFAALLGMVIIGSNTVFAAEQSLDLKTILSEALQKNPTVIEAEKNWQVEVNKITSAKTWPNPEFGIMKDDIPTGDLDFTKGMMTEYTFSQEIMYPGKLNLMGKMATNQALMAKANYQEQRINTYANAKQSYYDLLYASKALEIEKDIQQLMGQLAKIAQINYSTGMVPLADTLRAQTEFSKMTTDLVNMAAMEAVAKAKVKNVMGRPSNAAIAVKEEFNAPPPNFNLMDLQNMAAETKPAVIGMQYGVEMARNDIALAKKEKLPDFKLRLGYKDAQSTMVEDSWNIELMAMLPIWQKKNVAEIKRAASGLEAAQASLQNMKNMSELDVQMALTDAQSIWRQSELYKNTIVPQAEQTYHSYVVSYTNGKADLMAVLDSLAALRDVKLAYYKTKIDYEKAAANLEKAVGKPLFVNIEKLAN